MERFSWGLRLFFIGNFVSNVGMWMQVMAQGWLVADLSPAPFWSGFVGFCSGFPMLVLSLPGGVLSDRISRRGILLVSQLMLLVLAATLALLTRTGIVTLSHVAILSFLTGTVSALSFPAYSSFLYDIAGKRELTRAVSLNATQLHISRMVGPGIAGTSMALIGAWGCFALNSLSFLAVIPLIALIPVSSIDTSSATSASFSRNITETLEYVREEKGFIFILLVTALLSILVMPHMTLLPLFVKEYLNLGPGSLGMMWVASAFGSVLASVLYPRFSALTRGNPRVSVGGAAGCALSLFGLSQAQSAGWVAVCLFCVALLLAFVNISTQDFLQHNVKPAFRGRVLSLWGTLFQGMFPVGNILIGSVAEAVGIPLSFTFAAIVLLLALFIVKVPASSPPKVML